MPAIPFHQGRSRRRFMLMPLVDVIFLLLTFFMLSSQISPYAVMPVGAGSDHEEAGSEQAGQPGPAASLLVTVAPLAVQVNGEALSFTAFANRAQALRTAAEGAAIVVPRRSASVQDVVAVLEILRRAQFSKVSIRTRDAT